MQENRPEGGIPSSYAGRLKLANKRTIPKSAQAQGSTMAVYPTEEGTAKTSEETKAALKNKIDPIKMGIPISKINKIGNGGVVLQTTSVAAVSALKEVIPPGFRTSEPGCVEEYWRRS